MARITHRCYTCGSLMFVADQLSCSAVVLTDNGYHDAAAKINAVRSDVEAEIRAHRARLAPAGPGQAQGPA